MFKKLRIKFIAITMAMVAIVMALSFTAVCAIEYQRSLSAVETTLHDTVDQAASDNRSFKRFGDGLSGFKRFGDGQAPQGESETDGQSGGDRVSGQSESESRGEYAQGSSESITPPEIGNRRDEPRASNTLIPVAVYRIDTAGNKMLVPQVTSASISEDTLEDAISETQGALDGYGTIADLGLHYYKLTEDDQTYLAFADTSYTDGWKTLALVLALVGLATLVVFLVVSLFYSRWALKPVREAWDSQRQFVADASHDLKTPLTVILANAAILLKHPERSIASESQWIESTQIEAENMQGLINEMLELAQVEAGQEVEQLREPVDLSDLIDGETLLFDSIALERNCAFDCDIEAGIIVIGDEKQLKKMVATLVENAFKYVDENGAIDVTAHKEGKQATVAIHNTGSSISPDDLPHIFDRFYRTDKARTSGTGGFGLGLAIAREIARQHGGDITCKSADAEGTTFTITLPIG